MNAASSPAELPFDIRSIAAAAVNPQESQSPSPSVAAETRLQPLTTALRERSRRESRAQSPRREREAKTELPTTLEKCLPKQKGFERSVLLSLPPSETEGQNRFELSQTAQIQLYQQVEQFKRVVDLLPQDDPNVTLLAQMMKRWFPIWQRRHSLISKAKEKPLSRQEKNMLPDAAIFHSEEELLIAMGLLEQNRELASAALGYSLNQATEQEGPAEINLSDQEIELVIEEVKTRFGAEIAGKIKEFVSQHPTVTGAISGTVLAGLIEGIPAAIGQPLPPLFHITALALPKIGLAGGTIFQALSRRNEPEGGTTISLQFQETDSAVISTFAEQTGILGFDAQGVKQYFEHLEGTRHQVYAQAGLNLNNLNARLSLETGLIGTRDVYGSARLSNAFTAAARGLLGEGSFADLPPEEQLRIRVEAVNTAITSLCNQEAAEVIDAVISGEQETTASQVAEIEKIAREILAGKRSRQEITQEEIDEKRTEQRLLDQRLEEFETINTALEATTEELQPLQSQLTAAELRIETLEAHYQPIIERSQRKIDELEEKINDIHEARRTANQSLERAEAQITNFEQQLNHYRNQLETARQKILAPKIDKIEAQSQINPLEYRQAQLLEQATSLRETNEGLDDLTTFRQYLIGLRQQRQALENEIQQMNQDLQAQQDRPEALVTEADSREAMARLRIAQLGRTEEATITITTKDGRRETITQKAKLLEITKHLITGNPPKTYEGWLRLLFGPDALTEEYALENRRLCSKADMVAAAIEVWSLGDHFFQDPDSLQTVRDNLRRIEEGKTLLTRMARQARQRLTIDGETVTRPGLEAEIEDLNEQNTQLLTGLYDQVNPLLSINPVRSSQFGLTLINRLLEKGLSDPLTTRSIELPSSSQGIIRVEERPEEESESEAEPTTNQTEGD